MMGWLRAVDSVRLPDQVSADDGVWPLLVRGDSVDGVRLEFKRAVGSPIAEAPDAVLVLRFGTPTAGAALVGFTRVTFDGARSKVQDLSYFLEFGDGQTATGQSATHALERVQEFTARLTVVDRFGRTNAEAASYWVMPLGGWPGSRWAQMLPSGRRLDLWFHARNGGTWTGVMTAGTSYGYEVNTPSRRR